MNNKLIKIVSVALILILGGCGILENKNTREYMEKHFSYLEKVYPTRNVEELFEKFPNGAKINHSISSRNEDGGLTVSYFELNVDSKQHRIYGTERKVNILGKQITELYLEDVEYNNGKVTYINNTHLDEKKIDIFIRTI